MGTMVLPGVYVNVRDEGLISVGGISVGTVGVVGTAKGGEILEAIALSSYSEAKAIFGTPVDQIDAAKNNVATAQAALNQASGDERAAEQNALNEAKATLATLESERYSSDLLGALEVIFANGASSVYAVRSQGETATSYTDALEKLENELINIVTVAGKGATNVDIMNVLKAHLNTTSAIQRERIAVVGSNASTKIDDLVAQKDNVVDDDGRIVYVAPGIINDEGQAVGGIYNAYALTGLIASLPVRTSPTNKVLNIKNKLSVEFNFAQLEKLVQENIVCVERREGYRVVKGVTTATNTAWSQITTRRIVDKAVYGVRSACNPYIGKLNNTRVRSAMKATIDGFLTRMLEEESLTNYTLEVSATRSQEIAGIAVATIMLQPTFSIDFIQVTMNLG